MFMVSVEVQRQYIQAYLNKACSLIDKKQFSNSQC